MMKKLLLAAALSSTVLAMAPQHVQASSEPFIGEIMFVPYNFAPRGWAFCDGQLLPINQNQALFSILGTMYGGDGRTSFALPDMRGRTPVHVTTGYPQGAKSGSEQIILTTAQMPSHKHNVAVSTYSARTSTPNDNVLARPRSSQKAYQTGSPNTPLVASTIGNTGANAAINKVQPSNTLNCIIALQGLFPSRN